MTTKNGLVIWGAGGHARTVADIVRRSEQFTLLGFLDDVDPGRTGEAFYGSRILGGAEQLESIAASGDTSLVIAVGDNAARLAIAEKIAGYRIKLESMIDPSAVISPSVTLKAGVVIAPGAIVNGDAMLGSCVIVNSNAVVEHDCVLADAVHVGPGAILCGHATVGAGTLIGAGAVVRDRIQIGRNTVIGAGAVVVTNIPENVVAFGVPAKVVRSRQAD